MLRVIWLSVYIAFVSAAYAAEVELRWDNNTASYPANIVTWIQGFGNDFDVATLKTDRAGVKKFRVYTTPDWPNAGWEGFFLSRYDFPGVPASRVWPTAGSYAFFKPTGTGWNWYEYSLDFPLERPAFIAAAEVVYSWPNCDPLMVDTNPTPRRHSWFYYVGTWGLLEGPYGYSNLMLRVVVYTEATYPGVAPLSWGRVKGLYY